MSVGPAPQTVAWRPSDEYRQRSRLLRFMRALGVDTVEALVQRAAREPAWFWAAVEKDLELEWFEPYTQVLEQSRGLPFTIWWINGRMNYVHNALDKHVTDAGNRTALIWEGEEGGVRRLSYRELCELTNRAANGLKALGIGPGDRVGIYLPMIPETVAAVLACGKIGAIFTPIFSGYGPEAVASRLRDCDARLLITADGFPRRGKVVPMKAQADQAVAEAPSVARTLVVRRTGGQVPWHAGRDAWWHEAVDPQSPACATLRTSADDPYMIIYTSGTTGRPKGAVHVHGGFPVKGAQDLAHCFDLQAGDTLFWLTDLGWMMGPWAISGALMLGATLVIYDGAPDYPEPDRLWSLVERHRITTLGLSPTLIRALMTKGDELVTRHDLSSLQVLGSTGEPWNPDPWWWYFRVVGGGRCPIINYSGGTEVSGGIVGCTTIQPIQPCSFSGPCPGMAVDVVDEQGRPVRGEVGELVLKGPWPGMTRGFWQDEQRYLETYWSRWPDTWVHGDWAKIDAEGFWYILGRSDDTLKVAGKRVGPAEVESAAVSHPAVAEAAACGLPHEIKGETIGLFCVLRPKQTPSDSLREAIRAAVARVLGPALKPETVRFVRELPKTRNGKVLRRLVRPAYLGEPIRGDLSSLENAAALQAIAESV